MEPFGVEQMSTATHNAVLTALDSPGRHGYGCAGMAVRHLRGLTAIGSERESVRTQCVVVVGPLPPPVHGAAQITSAVVDLLGRTAWHVTTIDTAVRDGASGINYHQKRIQAHVRAVWTLLMLRRARSTRALYWGRWWKWSLVSGRCRNRG